MGIERIWETCHFSTETVARDRDPFQEEFQRAVSLGRFFEILLLGYSLVFVLWPSFGSNSFFFLFFLTSSTFNEKHDFFTLRGRSKSDGGKDLRRSFTNLSTRRRLRVSATIVRTSESLPNRVFLFLVFIFFAPSRFSLSFFSVRRPLFVFCIASLHAHVEWCGVAVFPGVTH